MKKTFFYIGCLALLVAGCNKVETEVTPVEEPAVESTRHLTVDINVEYPGDTRSLKTGWEEGDKIYVVFDHYFSDVLKPTSGTYYTSETAYYMTLTYTGNSWASEFTDDALENYLLETVEGQGRTGILSAVYFSDLKPQFQYSFQEAGAVDSYRLDFLNGKGAPGFFLTNNTKQGEDDEAVKTYSVVDDKLTATLRMRIPDNMVHFFLEGVGPEDYQRFSLKCSHIAPGNLSSFLRMRVHWEGDEPGEKYLPPYAVFWDWRDRYGEAIPAAKRSDGIAFCGLLKNITDQNNNLIETVVGQEAEYFIQVIDNNGTPNDSSDDIIHTLTKTATLNSKDAVKLPALDSGRWVDYEDVPIRFESDVVKRIVVDPKLGWDANGDGELSYAEAAAVTSLEGKFSNSDYDNPSIPRSTEFTFDELQYFTGLTSIGDHEFENTSLTSVILPSTIQSIGYSAFGSTKITSIVIPEGVSVLSHFVFEYTPLQSLHIPASLTEMISNPVVGCENLTSITVAEGNPVYSSPENCNAIVVTSAKTLFAGCVNTVIPDDIETIGYNAFNGCINLHSIEIPSSVTVIQDAAFAYTGLRTVVIPESVTTIGSIAFLNYEGENELTCITILATNPQPSTDQMLGAYSESFPICVPDASIAAYKAAWPDYADRIRGLLDPGFSGFKDEITW